MIQLKNITKTYYLGSTPVPALKGVDLTIPDGESVAIVGPSGSGKSTLMHIMGLLDSPTSGEYYLDGVATSSMDAATRATHRNRHIGFVFQQFNLLPKQTAIDNVALPLLYRGVDAHTRREQALAMLDRVGMLSRAKHRPSELSGGQQQRVAIARALVGQPSLILADEPTGALDTKTSQNILELLLSFTEHATVVLITHDLAVAEQCQRQIHVLDGLCT
jgi:putative ABC transport system ATP-binding protein